LENSKTDSDSIYEIKAIFPSTATFVDRPEFSLVFSHLTVQVLGTFLQNLLGKCAWLSSYWAVGDFAR